MKIILLLKKVINIAVFKEIEDVVALPSPSKCTILMYISMLDRLDVDW